MPSGIDRVRVGGRRLQGRRLCHAGSGGNIRCRSRYRFGVTRRRNSLVKLNPGRGLVPELFSFLIWSRNLSSSAYRLRSDPDLPGRGFIGFFIMGFHLSIPSWTVSERSNNTNGRRHWLTASSPRERNCALAGPVLMLLEIITRREVSSVQPNLFDYAKGRPFNRSIAQDPSMFEAISAFLIVLSVGILIAHALDAFRPWT
jgi:hypothetical protein